jgi:hypothetical protein
MTVCLFVGAVDGITTNLRPISLELCFSSSDEVAAAVMKANALP